MLEALPTSFLRQQLSTGDLCSFRNFHYIDRLMKRVGLVGKFWIGGKITALELSLTPGGGHCWAGNYNWGVKSAPTNTMQWLFWQSTLECTARSLPLHEISEMREKTRKRSRTHSMCFLMKVSVSAHRGAKGLKGTNNVIRVSLNVCDSSFKLGISDRSKGFAEPEN